MIDDLTYIEEALGHLPAEAIARLLGISERTFFRYRQTRRVADRVVAGTLQGIRTALEDARNHGRHDALVQLLSDNAHLGTAGILAVVLRQSRGEAAA